MSVTLLSIIISILSLYISFTVANDVFSYSGCYLSSSLQSMGLSSKGSYTWQSPSYCENQCSGSVFIALTEGGNCYCGSGVDILSVSKQSESNCDTSCFGWPADMCGSGNGDYMNVYINRNKANTKSSSTVSVSGSLSSSSTTTVLTGSHSHSSLTTLKSVFVSSTTLSQSSTTSELTSSTQSSTDYQSSSSSSSFSTTTSSSTTSTTATTPTISSSFSSVLTSSTSSSTSASVSSAQLTTKIITESIITTSKESQHTVVMTAVSVVETVVPTASSNTNYNGTMSQTNNKSTSPLSRGAIAGIVVGCVVGVIIIVVLIVFYFLYTKHHSRALDIEESKQYQPYSFGDQDANTVFIPESTGYLNHGSIRSKFNNNNNNNNNSSCAWKLPSRSSTRNNSNSNVFNIRNGSIHSSATPTNRSVSERNETTDGNINNMSTFTNPSASKTHIMRRSQLPSTVFEEPTNASFYDGVQRFSTSSLPDMMEERKPLRIVNPDDNESVRVSDNEDSANTTTESGDSTSSSMDNEKC